ncbi:MAG: PEGA domain-containing protein [Kofleriaceae bacterium]|nr:PEGA domain-containing protein [Kofleriaceae bacterium]
MSKALAVATKCTTKEQFIESFYKFCDEQSFFVATLNQRPIGLETPFSINLIDRTPMLRGLCVVLDAWATPANPFGRPGIRLGIRRLTVESEETFARLAQRRACQGASSLDINAVPVPPPAAVQPIVDDPPTVPVVMPDRPVVPSVIAQLEHRTPGSDIVLPANPLMNLTDVSLEGFIDCTLYEETGSFVKAEPDFSSGEALQLSEADLAEPPPPPDFSVPAAPRRPTPVSLAPPVVATPPPRPTPMPTQPPVVVPPPVVVAPPIVAIPPPRPTPTPTQPPVIFAPEPAMFVPPEPLVDEQMVQASPTIGRATEGVLQPIRRAKRRTYIMAGGAVLGAVVLVAIIVNASSSGGSPEAEAAAAPAPTKKPTTNKPEQPALAANPTPPTPTPPTPTTDKPTPPSPTPPTSAEPPDNGGEEEEPVVATNPGEAPVVGSGPCRLDITSTPAGTKVVVDGKEIGPSPISLAGPCERHKVDLIHPRYKQSSHFVVLSPNAPKKLDVTLIRPTHQLVIKTTPPGATISIQGRRAGTSPTTVSVMGFSGIDVAITRPGYETVIKRVYSKTPTETLSIALKRYKW